MAPSAVAAFMCHDNTSEHKLAASPAERFMALLEVAASERLRLSNDTQFLDSATQTMTILCSGAGLCLIHVLQLMFILLVFQLLRTPGRFAMLLPSSSILFSSLCSLRPWRFLCSGLPLTWATSGTWRSLSLLYVFEFSFFLIWSLTFI